MHMQPWTIFKVGQKITSQTPPPVPARFVSYYAGSAQTLVIVHRTPCPRGTLLPVTPAGDVRSPAATRGDAETGRALQEGGV